MVDISCSTIFILKCVGWDDSRYVIGKYIKGNPHFDLVEIKTSPFNYGMALVRKLSVGKKLDIAKKQKNERL
jgi:hypothetical protein